MNTKQLVAVRDCGFSVSCLIILSHLFANEDCRNRDFVRLLNVNRSLVSHATDKMIRKGLIVRRGSGLLEITEKGRLFWLSLQIGLVI